MDGLVKHRCPPTPSLSPQKRTTSQSKTEPPLLWTNKRTIYTAGRPPWYNVTGTTFKEAFVIGWSKNLILHVHVEYFFSLRRLELFRLVGLKHVGKSSPVC